MIKNAAEARILSDFAIQFSDTMSIVLGIIDTKCRSGATKVNIYHDRVYTTKESKSIIADRLRELDFKVESSDVTDFPNDNKRRIVVSW